MHKIMLSVMCWLLLLTGCSPDYPNTTSQAVDTGGGATYTSGMGWNMDDHDRRDPNEHP